MAERRRRLVSIADETTTSESDVSEEHSTISPGQSADETTTLVWSSSSESLYESTAGTTKTRSAVDDDENVDDPRYVPKCGRYYHHDRRGAAEKHDESGDSLVRRPARLLMWRDRHRWQHDRYDELEQAPKSRQELIAVYGYDIRSADQPPPPLGQRGGLSLSKGERGRAARRSRRPPAVPSGRRRGAPRSGQPSPARPDVIRPPPARCDVISPPPARRDVIRSLARNPVASSMETPLDNVTSVTRKPATTGSDSEGNIVTLPRGARRQSPEGSEQDKPETSAKTERKLVKRVVSVNAAKNNLPLDQGSARNNNNLDNEVVKEALQLCSDQCAVVKEASQLCSDQGTVVKEASQLYSDQGIVVKEASQLYSDQGTVGKEASQLYSDQGTIVKEASQLYSDQWTVGKKTSRLYSDQDAVVKEASQLYSDQGTVGKKASRPYSDQGIAVKEASQQYSGQGTVVMEASQLYSNQDTALKEASELYSDQDTVVDRALTEMSQRGWVETNDGSEESEEESGRCFEVMSDSSGDWREVDSEEEGFWEVRKEHEEGFWEVKKEISVSVGVGSHLAHVTAALKDTTWPRQESLISLQGVGKTSEARLDTSLPRHDADAFRQDVARSVETPQDTCWPRQDAAAARQGVGKPLETHLDTTWWPRQDADASTQGVGRPVTMRGSPSERSVPGRPANRWTAGAGTARGVTPGRRWTTGRAQRQLADTRRERLLQQLEQRIECMAPHLCLQNCTDSPVGSQGRLSGPSPRRYSSQRAHQQLQRDQTRLCPDSVPGWPPHQRHYFAPDTVPPPVSLPFYPQPGGLEPPDPPVALAPPPAPWSPPPRFVPPAPFLGFPPPLLAPPAAANTGAVAVVSTQSGGVTYYSPETQRAPSCQPLPSRPSAAVPIVPPGLNLGSWAAGPPPALVPAPSPQTYSMVEFPPLRGAR